ncbi:MAG: carboxypeptidase-like regulatory domain-containing protein [bacterium]
MLNQRFKNLILFIALSTVLIYSCKEDSVSTGGEVHSVYGKATFLDGTPAVQAKVQLKNLTTSRLFYDTSDVNGGFNFSNMINGNYVVRFASPAYEVNSYVSDSFDLTVSDIEHDFFITYKMLDDQEVYRIDDAIFFIKFNADAGRIGNNHDKVSRIIGYHSANAADSISLSCLVYKIPDGFDWETTSIEITPEYIAQNFTLLFEADEELNFQQHEIVFIDEMVPKILSNPSNGFAFVKKSAESKRIEVPCVDRQNNDYGLLFEYQL